MTTATVPAMPSWGKRAPRGAGFIADESPGGLGSAEVWIDESAMDAYGRGDTALAVKVVGGSSASWLGATVEFTECPGSARPVTYVVTARRTGPGAVNLGRPYYVLRWSH